MTWGSDGIVVRRMSLYWDSCSFDPQSTYHRGILGKSSVPKTRKLPETTQKTQTVINLEFMGQIQKMHLGIFVLAIE